MRMSRQVDHGYKPSRGRPVTQNGLRHWRKSDAEGRAGAAGKISPQLTPGLGYMLRRRKMRSIPDVVRPRPAFGCDVSRWSCPPPPGCHLYIALTSGSRGTDVIGNAPIPAQGVQPLSPPPEIGNPWQRPKAESEPARALDYLRYQFCFFTHLPPVPKPPEPEPRHSSPEQQSESDLQLPYS